MNLPNKLTLARILLIPVFILLVSMPAIPLNYLWAAVVFALASITDFLDGAIARKYKMVTDFGKFADPLADKILTTAAFIYMMVAGVCHPLVLFIVLTREFAVSGVRMVAAGAPGGKVIAANMWGKVKTVLQMLSIIFYYFCMGLAQCLGQVPGEWLHANTVTNVLCWLVALVTALSGVQYIWGNRHFINTAK